MNTQEAFLADVIEHPDDDAPRLIFADWLDDHGDPDRAEFIRLQCRLARLSEENPQRQELRFREAELLGRGGEWLEPLLGLVSDFQFRRGFVEAVEVRDTTPDLAGRIRQAMTLAPVRSLRLVLESTALAEVPAAGACLGRLRELYLYPQNDPAEGEVLRLFGSGAFGGLTALHVDCNESYLTRSDATGLLRPGLLPPLTRLGLHYEQATVEEDGEVLTALAEAGHLAGLSSLCLAFFAFNGHAKRLAGCPAFAALKDLDLRQSFATEECWRELLWSPSLDRLRRLGLGRARLDLSGSYQSIKGSPFEAEVAEWFPEVDYTHDTAATFTLPTWWGLA